MALNVQTIIDDLTISEIAQLHRELGRIVAVLNGNAPASTRPDYSAGATPADRERGEAQAASSQAPVKRDRKIDLGAADLSARILDLLPARKSAAKAEQWTAKKITAELGVDKDATKAALKSLKAADKIKADGQAAGMHYWRA